MAGPGRLGATGGFLSGLPDRLPPEAGRGSGARLAVGHASQRRPRISQNHNLGNRSRSPRSGYRSGRPPLSLTFSGEERKGFEARKYFLKGGDPGWLPERVSSKPPTIPRAPSVLLSTCFLKLPRPTFRPQPKSTRWLTERPLTRACLPYPLSNRGTWTWAT